MAQRNLFTVYSGHHFFAVASARKRTEMRVDRLDVLDVVHLDLFSGSTVSTRLIKRTDA